MPTGLVLQILVVLLRGGVCFLEMPTFLGRVRSKLVSRNHPPNLNIRLCRRPVLKLYGFEVC
jgi:hypothetical protein